ncbi:hypothetical protein DUNSADRAFT_5898 [Dunaliella salina]|uniref:DUF1995 domain-containing protein n=1 Tax=Dunaliella salina TaxID=3046 RepID=A0ABQ7GPB9_DUNSA|nr:hypothetical protein DUNSADRAFT_5898 [Dunaliella salina]|eukprot:KAF5836451.1 hypothetical protein DUNSADRAFT_5898 [Dunaliella salina]
MHSQSKADMYHMQGAPLYVIVSSQKGPIFPNKGDQERFWRITRRFVDELGDAYIEGGTSSAVNAVYPDSGVAAMLSYQWKEDKKFRITSLNDRRPVQPEDELVVVVAPDPPGADECLSMIKQVSNKEQEEGLPEKPIVLFNQRLASGDVGLGLNVRRMRNFVLKDFAITYSLRPLGFGEVGTVYRRYPGMWQVFLQDPELPGRYRLVAEKPSRPEGEYLDYLVQQAMGTMEDEGKEGQQGGAGGIIGQLQRTANSLNSFMKSLSK